VNLPPEEPAAGPWRVEPVVAVAATLAGRPTAPDGRPAILAVDGRSSSGKTSLSRRLAEAVPGAAVVHTDDVAWWHAAFDWAGLLAGGVLEPVRAGRAVAYRPPVWDLRERPGAVTVPAGISLLVVEGVGSSRRALAHLLDASVWVQSDLDEVDRRNAARVQAGEISPAGFDSWMAEEFPFLAADRPWERATLIVAGTPPLPHDPGTELVVADPPPVRRR
jgi:hypothetical protein